MSLKVPSSLSGPIAFPLATEILVVLRGPPQVGASIQVGSVLFTPLILGEKAEQVVEADWVSQCTPGQDCVIPITLAAWSPGSNWVTDPPGPTPTYKAGWSIEVRLDLLSPNGTLPPGSFELQSA